MDGRLFGIPRSSHRPAYYYSFPVHRQPPAKSPKVVSIPVQFVESEPTRSRSRSELVAKIQAAFRGFIVRKYVRKLDVMRREVEEIERRVCEEETVELMKSDERERFKVNEVLMSLLFRLDSVRGVDSGVRELRKKVIRKAIALQEKVDAIAAVADLANQKEGGAAEVEQSEVGGVDSSDSPDQEEGSAEAEQIEAGGVDSSDSPDQEEESIEAEQIEEQVADLPDRKEGGSAAAQSEEPVLDLPDQKEEGGVEAEQGKEHDINLPGQEEGSSEGSDHVVDNVNDACDLIMGTELPPSETSRESRSDTSLNPESFLEEVDENAPTKEDDEAEQVESSEEKEVEEADEENDRTGNSKDDNNRSEKMLGRMMDDNEKMMGMMMQLFERNERQTQLLSLLSQRVERLEKAFLCEKQRRKKKRQADDGERLLNSYKCGKKL